MEKTDQRLQRARRLIEVGRHPQALTELSEHLATAPDDAEALCLTALCLLGERNAVGAERAVESAIRARPDWEWPFRIRSIALTQLRRFDDALDMARESVRLAPDLWQTHSQLATALVNTGNLKEAVLAARRAVELAPDESDAHLTVAIAADARMRRREERRELHKALELDPDNAMALNNLAALDMNRGRLGRGTRGLVGALAMDPQQRILHANLDVVGMRIVGRMLQTLLLGGVALTILFVLEDEGTVPFWWPRATLGTLLFVVCAAVAWSTLRHVPPRGRAYLRGLPGRSRGRERLWLVLFALSAPTVLWLAFMPGEVAGAAILLLVFLIRIVQVMFLVWLVVTLGRWVRTRF